MPESRDLIAIVGMAALFPGAPDKETYWSNITRGVSAISEVPPGRLDPAFFGSDSNGGDRFYCRRGGFVDSFATFGATSFGVMPIAARGAEPDQLLTLQLAAAALADAGYQKRPFARDRASVLLGRGGYPGSARARLDAHVRGAEQLVVALRGLLPDLKEEQLRTIKREFQRATAAPGKDAVIGLVPNLTASRIAERLDLHGPAYTIDAACASALVAVDQACLELGAGRCDLAIAGGVHFCQDEAFWSVFTELGALSRHGESRPFDKRADGLLIGEGAGLVVLKRLTDAHRDNDRVYAVVRGTGTSSDGRGASLMSPQRSGQVLALTRAWDAAGLDRSKVGLIEAHGTGTLAGDETELATLREVFGELGPSDTRAVLGSVKSMIGHTMPAAGAAGLIKAALSIFHGVLPPTLHCEQPRDELAKSRFRTIAESETWHAPLGERICGVNAFGFGGINAHVVLSGDPTPHLSAPRAQPAPPPRAAFFSAATVPALLSDIAHGRERIGGGPSRLALYEPSPERLEKACDIVKRGRPWRERDGIFFSPDGLLSQGGKLAFVFPGVDASFDPRVEDVAEYFGLPVPQHLTPKDLEETGIAIVGVGRLLDAVLRKLGVTPDHVAGHSIGEWSAMISTGVIPDSAVDRFVSTLEPGSLEVPGVVFAAAGCDVTRATAAILGLPDIALSHDNCPHQVLVCGKEASIDVALERLRADGVLCQKLPFQSGYHTPLFTSYLGVYRDTFRALPIQSPREPLWSATSCERFPADPDAIRALAVEHLVKPVRFRELIARLHAEGVRVFVQVGTGRVLNFVEDTLRGRPHVAFSANTKEKTGMDRLRALMALLFVEGAAIDPTVLFEKHKDEIHLSLSAPLVRSFTPLKRPVAHEDTRDVVPGSPLAKEWSDTLSAIRDAERDVMSEFTRKGRDHTPRTAEFPREFSLETMPDLIDHTFYRQPLGWPVLSDRHPVVPMTTLIEVMLEHAEEMVKGQRAIGLENVRAFRWFVVSTPVKAKVSCKFDGKDRVFVRIEDYCEGTVLLGDTFAEDFSPPFVPLDGARPVAIDAETLYRERWMFHGPQFQGVEKLLETGDNGIHGTIRAPRARGALLDNAGQLFGYWVMARYEENRMAMPVRIDRVQLFSSHPLPGEEVDCDVRITSVDERSVTADLLLSRKSGPWCRLSGWEDRRFETDARIWAILLFPERNLLGDCLSPGLVVFRDKYRAAPTRDQFARRFLGESERALYEKQTPRQQRAWLNAKIAAKDAVRDLLRRGGAPPLFPVEVKITRDEPGLVVASCDGDTFYVPFVQSGDLTFAKASHTPASLQLVTAEAAKSLPQALVVRFEELALTWGPKEIS